LWSVRITQPWTCISWSHQLDAKKKRVSKL
jgi:hypothetical protein